MVGDTFLISPDVETIMEWYCLNQEKRSLRKSCVKIGTKPKNTFFFFKLWTNSFFKKIVNIRTDEKLFIKRYVFLRKPSRLNLVEIIVKTLKTDDENHTFHIRKLVMISKWNSGNSAYRGRMCNGTHSSALLLRYQRREPGPFQPDILDLSPP